VLTSCDVLLSLENQKDFNKEITKTTEGKNTSFAVVSPRPGDAQAIRKRMAAWRPV
jgi:hypothetical protein